MEFYILAGISLMQHILTYGKWNGTAFSAVGTNTDINGSVYGLLSMNWENYMLEAILPMLVELLMLITLLVGMERVGVHWEWARISWFMKFLPLERNYIYLADLPLLVD